MVWDQGLNRYPATKVVLGAGRTSTECASPAVSGILVGLLEEAQVTGQLDRPGIVPVHGPGPDVERREYFTMRFVKGRHPREVLEPCSSPGGDRPRARIVDSLLEVRGAMTFAHSKGMIHRDLERSNVMVGKLGEVHVMDRGRARAQSRRLTR